MNIQNTDRTKPVIINSLSPTRKQIERDIAHRFYAFNSRVIGSHPETITCTIFDRYLTVVGESAMTPIERAIYQRGEKEIVLAMRASVNQTLQVQLDKIIRELMQIEPLDSFCELSLSTERLVAFAILSESPRFRIRQSRQKKSEQINKI